MDTIERVIEELRAALPPVLAGQSLAELTGNAMHWPTVQNARSRREIPEECFVYAGRKVLIVRDPFLAWWKTTLRAA
ncbi:hypothetical protein [Desulfovibrio sp. DV]|uniref:hypothetical protein n=1 Tax=Desulfovibrio sp. DV TaxID=1844708 RepID=UPI00094B98E5|nr:hypothetical protein [Desulfovibrio sp. DV]